MKKISFLLGAGIPFIECLYFIIQKERNKKKKECLKKIMSHMHSGFPLHKSFAVYPLIIDKVSLGIIKNAEATGTLSKSCHNLSIFLEEKLANRNRISSALLYPFCIMVFAIVLIVILLFFIFPKIIPLIQSSGATIPLSTKIFLFLFNFLSTYGLFLLVSISSIGFFLGVLYKKNTLCKYLVHEILLVNPLFRFPIHLYKVSSFSKEVSLFLGSGYSILEVLSSVAEHEENLLYKKGIIDITEDIRKGIRFSKTLENHSYLFGRDMPLFVALGEETGKLSSSLLQVSFLYDEELKNLEKKIFTLLEPMMMLVLGVIVGFIALSLITPLYSITSSINNPSLT